MPSTINADNGVSSGSAGLKSAADSSGVLSLQTNGTTAVTVDTSQNVGVGTASPGVKLDVVGSSGQTLRLRNGSTATEYYDIGRDGADGLLAFNGAQTTFVGYKWSTTGTERMRIDSSGNLLVGTTSASGARLNVNGDVQQRGTNGRITQAVKGIGSTVSSITVDVGGGLDGTSYFVEISLSGYQGVYLRYIHTVYKTNSWTDYSPSVVQNLASLGVSVAYSSPSAGVLRYTITASTTYPVVQVKVTSGGTTVDAPTTISIS